MQLEHHFGPDHYVPALRWKAGEIRAFRHIVKAGLTEGITPLFVVDNYAERVHNEDAKKVRIPKAPGPYIAQMASELQKSIQGRRAFVDTMLFDQAQRSERTPLDGLTALFGELIIRMSAAVPVIRISDSSVRRQQLRGLVVPPRGAALRLAAADVNNISAIAASLRDLHLRRRDVDLIVDLGFVKSPTAVQEKSETFAGLSKLAGSRQGWRTFTVLSGAFEKKTKKEAGPTYYVRYDLKTYQALRQVLQKRGKRLPAFGDYAIVHPDAIPTSGSGAGGGSWPIIRYCAGDSWVVWKSLRPAKEGEASPYLELARECAIHPAFMGREFSDGDEYIDDRALAKKTSGGNSTSFIQYDVNHHLTYTRSQVLKTLPHPAPRQGDEIRYPDSFAADLDLPEELEDLDDLE